MIDCSTYANSRNPAPPIFEIATQYGFSGRREILFRQVVVLDAQACACAGRGDRLEPAVRELAACLAESPLWPDSACAEGFVREFLRKKRECLWRLMRSYEPVSKAPTAYRGAVQSHLLVLLADRVPPDQWRDTVLAPFSQLPPRWLSNVREEILQEHIALYQDADDYLMPEERTRLQQCRAGCVRTLRKMTDTVIRIARRENTLEYQADTPLEKSVKTERWHFDLSSSSEKLRLLYFLETCCAAQLEQEGPWQVYAKQNWSDFYPGVPFDSAVEEEIWRALRRQHSVGVFSDYCSAIGMVFRHGIKGIHSGAYLYHLLLGRAALLAAAYAPEAAGAPFGGELDSLLNDALDYRKRVPVPYAVAEQDEEQRLLDLLALYQRDGRYDTALLTEAAHMRKVFQKNFQALEDRVQDSNESNVLLSQMRSQLNAMQGDLEKADFVAKQALVRQMDRGSFGYRLGQMYRFAQGMDNKDPEQAREMLRTFFALLENIGVSPVCGERLGEEIPETDELFDKMIPSMGTEGSGKRVLQYPGWIVCGVQTEAPVYITVKE